MTKEDIKRIIEQEQENIKLFEEKQQQFQELIDKAKINIASAKNFAIEPKNPYERVKKGEIYYSLSKYSYGIVAEFGFVETNDEFDNISFKNGLYFNNKPFTEKTAKEIELYLKLKKFTYENGWSEELWNDNNSRKHYFYRDISGEITLLNTMGNRYCNVVYFKTREIAQQAIETFRELIEEVL